MKENFVSVIVPIYNAEKSIGKCIKSLQQQTLENIEIILVNDGSTDNSQAIIEGYAESDARIRVLNKENGGVSSARNYGIVNSSSKYISFVDADDWCEKDMFESMYNIANDSLIDFVSLGYTIEDQNGKIIKVNKSDKTIQGFNKEKIAQVFLGANLSYSVGKLYNSNIIYVNKIRFDENISLGEDASFVYDYLLHIKSAAVMNRELYHYVQYYYGQSLSTTYAKNIEEFVDKIWEKKQKLFYRFPHYKVLSEKNSYNKDIFKTIMCIYNNYRVGCNLSSRERRQFIKKFMDNANVERSFKVYRPHKFKDKIFFMLFKLNSPLIMDVALSINPIKKSN